jgi:hypothetical protein
MARYSKTYEVLVEKYKLPKDTGLQPSLDIRFGTHLGGSVPLRQERAIKKKVLLKTLKKRKSDTTKLWQATIPLKQ